MHCLVWQRSKGHEVDSDVDMRRFIGRDRGLTRILEMRNASSGTSKGAPPVQKVEYWNYGRRSTMERPRSSKSAGTNKASTRRLRSRETVELTREASEENVRVYSRDVLEDLLEDASISPTSSFRSRDKALADVSDWGAQATGRSSPAMPPIPGSRSTTRRDSNGSMGIWERGTTPVALSTARRQGKLMTQRELEKMKKKQEEYEKINADYERNQVRCLRLSAHVLHASDDSDRGARVFILWLTAMASFPAAFNCRVPPQTA